MEVTVPFPERCGFSSCAFSFVVRGCARAATKTENFASCKIFCPSEIASRKPKPSQRPGKIRILLLLFGLLWCVIILFKKIFALSFSSLASPLYLSYKIFSIPGQERELEAERRQKSTKGKVGTTSFSGRPITMCVPKRGSEATALRKSGGKREWLVGSEKIPREFKCSKGVIVLK